MSTLRLNLVIKQPASEMRTLIQTAILIVLVQNVKNLGVVRRTKYGFVRGEIATSAVEPCVQFYSWRGVPYASPPVGKLRFKEPIPPKPWIGIKETIKPTITCPQIADHFLGKGVIGTEDCLKIDIYEPITAREDNNPLPVIVWIHGGAFIYGQADSVGADYFMKKPIVVVVIEYRLNVLGFLTTMDKEAPGNVGLKDQRLALQWINENIVNFGGDPNLVTITGGSAGGASVLCHMMNKQSQRYFQRAISQSGVTPDRWAIQTSPKEMTFKLAAALGIRSTDSKTIVEKLQAVSYQTLIETGFDKSVVGFYTNFYAYPFVPTIEMESETAIMSERTLKLLAEGNFARKPFMMGYSTEEGSYAYGYIPKGVLGVGMYKEDPGWFVPISLNIPRESPNFNKSLDEILNFYFESGDVTNKYEWTNYMSQELFVRAIVKVMTMMYKHLPLYFYHFSFVGSTPMGYLGGAGHYNDVQFLYYNRTAGPNATQTPEDWLTRDRLTTLWYNFAVNGNPTPTQEDLLENQVWPRVDENMWYMDIGKDLILRRHPSKKDFDFWERLFKKYGNPPYDIY